MSKILEMKDIYKVYPNGVVASRRVNFSLEEGEIHAICGENGAGKSTLMKMLFGMEQPSEGTILKDGEVVTFKTPMEAINAGIGMVHQHFMLVPSLSIAENIVLGMEPKSKLVFTDKKKMFEETEALAKRYNFKVNVREKIQDSSVGTRQKVEILKALHRGAKILILDEPTAVLTPQETEELFVQLKFLKENGHTIVFISHKLNEVKELCDRITVLRRGETTHVFDAKDATKEEISNMMVGKTLEWGLDKKDRELRGVNLKAKGLSKVNMLDQVVVNDVSFSMRKGEILGLVGIEGNGQSELVEMLTGLSSIDQGSVEINGQVINKKSVKEIRDAGLSHIPEDRMTVGIAKGSSIEDNLLSIYYDKKEFSKHGLLNFKKISKWSRDLIKNFQVLAKDEDTLIGSLSGGNIQKVVVAREFSNGSEIIIANQPTRGVDIGAAKFIHTELLKLRDNGAAVLLSSADLTEILDLCDSIIVMFEGSIVAYFDDISDLEESDLGLYMMGIEKQTEGEISRCVYE